ncbi:hypothetical protein MTR_5g073300 [Medicago truncatula]|uniref:Uncharacterized protein n=1 Tax=Medicago truncatula TaxID=3880 RepID=G7JZQ2_MEDTR|nr:hypothetical protein MTR_5g073300 [Medicago truncatula]
MSGDFSIGAQIHYDYNNNISTSERNHYFVRPSSFNSDFAQFSWCKSKMYSHIIEVDDELWDIIEDGVIFSVVSVGMVVDRKSMIEAQRKIYRKHRIVHDVLVEVLLHPEYTKIVDKSIFEAIFESLCSNYDGNQFQTLVSSVQVLNKRYIVPDHVKKILRNLPARFRPKVTTIQNVYLSGNEPPKKSKSIALKSKGKSSKALQVIESNQETPYGDYEDGSDVKRWHL